MRLPPWGRGRGCRRVRLGGGSQARPPQPPLPPQPPSSSTSSTGRRPWRACSPRTAGATPHCCGRSSAAPRGSPATTQVGASSPPPRPLGTTHSRACGMGWSPTAAAYVGPGPSLPAHSPLSPYSHPVARPQENRPVRRPKETLVSGQGHPSAPRLPPAPPARYPGCEQGAASSIQFSFHTSLPLENGSHHPGRPPSCLCPVHCLAPHPLGTEGWDSAGSLGGQVGTHPVWGRPALPP